MMKFKKIRNYLFVFIALIGVYVLYILFSSNTNFDEKQKYIYLPTGSTYQNLLANLKEAQCLKSMSSFERLADKLNLKNHVHPGKYKIENGMGNYSLVAPSAVTSAPSTSFMDKVAMSGKSAYENPMMTAQALSATNSLLQSDQPQIASAPAMPIQTGRQLKPSDTLAYLDPYRQSAISNQPISLLG